MRTTDSSDALGHKVKNVLPVSTLRVPVSVLVCDFIFCLHDFGHQPKGDIRLTGMQV